MERPSLPNRVAVVGCGVIGAGWASRFALNGVDVNVADPSPTTRTVVDEVYRNALAAWDQLGIDRPEPGEITVFDATGDAVADVDFVQESVPERESVKHSVLSQIERAAPVGAVIASSTSGIRPTVLQSAMAHPERLVVGHPFNPVYLLPLVEVVGGERTSPEILDLAHEIYEAIGMHPLRVRVEIDAFIADRLMEAVWREALWLVHDGVATTSEIDTAFTRGFGLRWAQMGLFETFRAGGGSDGFPHFLAQFGPALQLPWTHLVDVPDLDDELIGTIVEQSDQQTGDVDARTLERMRDRNLVSILAALEANDWGAGQDVAEMRVRLAERAQR